MTTNCPPSASGSIWLRAQMRNEGCGRGKWSVLDYLIKSGHWIRRSAASNNWRKTLVRSKLRLLQEKQEFVHVFKEADVSLDPASRGTTLPRKEAFSERTPPQPKFFLKLKWTILQEQIPQSRLSQWRGWHKEWQHFSPGHSICLPRLFGHHPPFLPQLK